MEKKALFDEFLKAGVHFGHLKKKRDPKMAPYIFMERNKIHIIDLHKTISKLDIACKVLSQIAKSGKKIMFVGTKKQAKESIEKRVSEINMPYVTERWPGGMLTNFVTIRKAVRKMDAIDKMEKDGTLNNLSKRERLQIFRKRQKLETNLGSIADLTRIPAALFIVDINKEHIAVAEARKLNIPCFAITDTNTNPTHVNYAIPGNDDASSSIDKILEHVVSAIKEGLSERKQKKDEKKSTEKEDSKNEAKTHEVEVKETDAKKTDKVEKKPKPRIKKAVKVETDKVKEVSPAKKNTTKKAPAKKITVKKVAVKKKVVAKKKETPKAKKTTGK